MRLARPEPRRPASSPIELVERYAGLVRQIVGGFKRKLPRSVQRDDLLAAGMAGLWDAVRRHGGHADDSFEWYARVRIRGAILDELRSQDWLPRRARAALTRAGASSDTPPVPLVVRLDDMSEWEQAQTLATCAAAGTEECAMFNLSRDALLRAIDGLPERERHIVAMHYFQGVKFKDLGGELGVSEPRISQLHSRAMQRLKAMLDAAA